MKKILFSLLLFLFSPVAFAIDWVSVPSLSGKSTELDLDSLKQEKGYYFYNIKFSEVGKKDVIITE